MIQNSKCNNAYQNDSGHLDRCILKHKHKREESNLGCNRIDNTRTVQNFLKFSTDVMRYEEMRNIIKE